MSSSFVIACPECQKQVRATDELIGKKIRCKGCSTIFAVEAPSEAPKKKNPDGEKAKTKPPPPLPPEFKKEGAAKSPPPVPPAPAATQKKPYEDDDDDGPANYGLIAEVSSMPRCPFCAKEMSSEEAKICLHCGYNTQTRLRPEVKKVHAHTPADILLWLMPGIICVLVMLGLVIWDIIFCMKVESWVASTLQESDGTWVGGLNPGFFKTMMTAVVVVSCFFLGKIAYKRLLVNNRPPEKAIEKEE